MTVMTHSFVFIFPYQITCLFFLQQQKSKGSTSAIQQCKSVAFLKHCLFCNYLTSGNVALYVSLSFKMIYYVSIKWITVLTQLTSYQTEDFIHSSSHMNSLMKRQLIAKLNVLSFSAHLCLAPPSAGPLQLIQTFYQVNLIMGCIINKENCMDSLQLNNEDTCAHFANQKPHGSPKGSFQKLNISKSFSN